MTIKQYLKWREDKRSGYHTFSVWATVKTRAKTYKGMAKAMSKQILLDDPYTEDEIKESIKTGFIDICDDGFVLLQCP